MTLDRVIKNRVNASWKIKQLEIARNAQLNACPSLKRKKEADEESEWVVSLPHICAEGYLVPNNDMCK